MGVFFGGSGSMLILLALLGVFCVFLTQINVVKKDTMLIFAKTSFFAFAVGAVYVCVFAYVCNTAKEQANLFDFGKIFGANFRSTEDIITSGKIFSGIKDLVFPVYPAVAHVIGAIFFDKYVPAAVCLSFLCAFLTSFNLYRMFSLAAVKNNVFKVSLMAATFPFVFYLFCPSCVSLGVCLVSFSLYAICKGKKVAALVTALVAAVTVPWGIIFVIFAAVNMFVPIRFTMMKHLLDEEIPHIMYLCVISVFSLVNAYLIYLYVLK